MVGQFARGHDGTLAVIGSAYLANGDGGQYIVLSEQLAGG
jgi:hypothetical protein